MGEDGILPPGSCNDLSEFWQVTSPLIQWDLCKMGKLDLKPRKKSRLPIGKQDGLVTNLLVGHFLTIHQRRQSSEKAGDLGPEGVKATKGSHLLRLYPGFSVGGQGSHGMRVGLEPPSRQKQSVLWDAERKAGESGRCGLVAADSAALLSRRWKPLVSEEGTSHESPSRRS